MIIQLVIPTGKEKACSCSIDLVKKAQLTKQPSETLVMMEEDDASLKRQHSVMITVNNIYC